jgi:hypothetical protein
VEDSFFCLFRQRTGASIRRALKQRKIRFPSFLSAAEPACCLSLMQSGNKRFPKKFFRKPALSAPDAGRPFFPGTGGTDGEMRALKYDGPMP